MTYPPYQVQPYSPQMGPYMPSAGFQPRVDAQPYPPAQGLSQAPQGPIQGLSPSSRPVTSREEAMGVAADFSGAPMIFPDVTHNRVYLKRWDLASGGPAFQEYAPVPPQEQAASQENAPWASIQDVQDLKDLVDRLQGEIERLKRPGMKGGKASDDGK